MDELIGDFLGETNEGLQTLDLELVKLEQNPNDKDILGGIFRVMHTIKGTCGFLGLPRLESVAHAGENILCKIRDEKINASPAIISLVLKSIDAIKSIISHIEVEEKEPEGNDKELIELLNYAAEYGIVDANNVNSISSAPILKKPEIAVIIPEKAVEETVLEVVAALEPLVEEPVADIQIEQPMPEVVNIIDDNIEQVIIPDVEIPAEIPPENKIILQEKPKIDDKIIDAGLKVVAKVKDNKHSHQNIRVNVDVLEGLMQMVSELVLTRNQLLQIVRSDKESEFTSPIQRLSHITSELQEKVMQTRMQPISSAWSQFPRLIRDLSIELGKKIELRMIGEETELDRQLIESIKDPLTHMVRNSADHGLETIQGRIDAGKDETGIITLKAYHQGGHIIIEISDDGRGINIDRIKAKAIENSLATEADLEKMSEQQIMQFIFKAGFSTAEKVTAISGRGVGMDVVRTNIEKISGTIEMQSIQGKGSKFLIKIPLTLAILSILIVECKGQLFGIPQINVIEMVKAGGSSEYRIDSINDKQILRLRESLLPLISLSDILKLKDKIEKPKSDVTFIVVCEVGGFSFGIIVDKIFDTEEIVVKPVAPVLKSIDVYSGSTLLGDGSVIMILDPNGLTKVLGTNFNKDSNQLHHSSNNNDKQLASFLILHVDNSAPKAVPLEIVSRLEEIDVSKIEYAGKNKVIQYRDSLMHLVNLDPDYVMPTSGMQQLVVFIDKEQIIGLVVKEIVDIVEHQLEIVSPSSPGTSCIGAIVIDGKTTDLIDVKYFFHQIFDEKATTATNEEQTSKATVIFVDDSPFFRKFIPPVLITKGYNVIKAASAKQALEILDKNNDILAIITDINMPGLSGIEFAEICRATPKLQEIPVIALSSNLAENVGSFDSKLFYEYIPKTSSDKLLLTIDQIFHLKKNTVIA